MRLIDVWYSYITDDAIRAAAEPFLARLQGHRASRRARLEALFAKARGKDALRAASSLTRIVDGRRVIVDDPPVIQHVEIPGGPDAMRKVFEDYRATMAESRREFLERYRFADFALKVVGVGSVGTRCFVLVLEGRDEDDPLILQAKEATASVLEEHLGDSGYANHGERVVVGQRLMQATPDIFLGWTRGPGGRDFYMRQLWDMKGSVDTSTLRPEGLGFYGGLCAWALARAHARSGDSVAISAYLGTSDTFDGADRRLRRDLRRPERAGPSATSRHQPGRHRGGAGPRRRPEPAVRPRGRRTGTPSSTGRRPMRERRERCDRAGRTSLVPAGGRGLPRDRPIPGDLASQVGR